MLQQDLGKKSSAIEESKSCIELMREEKNSALKRCSELEESREKSEAECCQLREAECELRHCLKAETSKVTNINEQFEGDLHRLTRDNLSLEQRHDELVAESRHKEEKAAQQQLGSANRIQELQTQLESVVEIKDEFALRVSR